MNNKNIMLCLDILGIGGVETFVVNQSFALKKKGYNVVVISKRGIYSEILEKAGIICLDFSFNDKEWYDYDKILEFINILKKYNINEVHINNQFTAMNIVFPACILCNIPYVVYLHMSSAIIKDEKLNAYNWFENKYSTYKYSFGLLFKYASKIVAVTPAIRDYVLKRYNLDINKCVVLPNSINFKNYISNNEVKKISNILIISRLTEEKEKSLINSLNLFIEIKKKVDRIIHLNIVGDGPIKQKIFNYIKNNSISDECITFYGAVNNVNEIIDQNDIVIGIDRCILEALAMRKLAIISSYNGESKGLVTKERIDVEIDENFCGNDLNSVSNEEIVNNLVSLTENDIKRIVDENYSIILNKLDINNNIYIVGDNYNLNYLNSYCDIYNNTLKMNNIIGNKLQNCIENSENIWNEHLKYKEWIEKVLKEKDNEVKEKNKKLEKIYSSKSYIFFNRIMRFLKKDINIK